MFTVQKIRDGLVWRAKRCGRAVAKLVPRGDHIRGDVSIRYEWFGGEVDTFPVAIDRLSTDSVVYSLGVGENIEFDLALIEKCHPTIYAFDPTPRTAEWLSRQNVPPEFHFEPIAVGGKAGTAEFYPPAAENHISHSLVIRKSPRGKGITVCVDRLPAIMNRLNTPHIDLLKMDVEGSEYEIVEDIIHSGVRIDQIAVEFHHRYREIGWRKTFRAIRQLRLAGYRIFAVSQGKNEYGLIHSRVLEHA